MKTQKTKHNTTDKENTAEPPSDTDLFDTAFTKACELYGPLGFYSPSHGILYNIDLNIELLPFYERGEETPVQYAIRSAFQAGRSLGRHEALKDTDPI